MNLNREPVKGIKEVFTRVQKLVHPLGQSIRLVIPLAMALGFSNIEPPADYSQAIIPEDEREMSEFYSKGTNQDVGLPLPEASFKPIPNPDDKIAENPQFVRVPLAPFECIPPPPPAPGELRIVWVDVIPEADSLFLLVGGLAALSGLVGLRQFGRRDDDEYVPDNLSPEQKNPDQTNKKP